MYNPSEIDSNKFKALSRSECIQCNTQVGCSDNVAIL
jgi:hypothetical protein